MSTSSVSRFKRKNTVGSRTDKGWDHGVDIEGLGRKVKCKYCGKCFTGGIFRFKNHLACTHSNVEACVSVPDEVKKEFREILSRSAELAQKKQRTLDDDEDCTLPTKNKGKGLTMSSSNRQSTINEMMKKESREDVCQQIARFFYTSAIPFNCVKNPEFVKMVDMVGRFGKGLKPPSYHEIRETYLNKEVGRTTKMLDDYRAEWKKTGCTIMSDGWSDRKRRSIVNFMVNSPKGTVFLSSLDTSNVSKTADFLCNMLNDIVEIVGEENVVQVVTDNAANYKAAGELLMQKRKTLFWTPCAAHCIDLILEDFEKKLIVHSETIAQARKITTYIYGRTIVTSMLRHFTKQRDIVRPALTRFATAYLTLGSLSDQKGALMTMFSSDAWKLSRFATAVEGKRVQHIILDSEFWKNVVICLKAAYPLIKVLRLVDSDEKPAMGFIYDAMDQAKQKIRDNFNNVKRSYEPIWNIIDERWECQLHRPLHAAAYYLNPQLHYRPGFEYDYTVKMGLYECLQKMVPSHEERKKIDIQLEYFKKSLGLFGIEAAVDARETKPPHTWWDAYGDGCPELRRFAIRILSLTCSSSGCERNWSAFEMVHSKRRNRLLQKKMNDLVFVMYNSKLQEKITRKEKELASLEDLDSDDEWITDEREIDDSQVERFSLLDETEQDTEEEDLMTILGRSSVQRPSGDDLEISDAFDTEGGSGNVISAEVGSSGQGCDDQISILTTLLATLLYTISVDGLPFPDRRDVFTPWFAATVVDFYINIVPIAVWIYYKQSNWFGSLSWIVLLLVFGSLATCAYVFLQLLKLTPGEPLQDLIYHLLLRDADKDGTYRGKNSPVVTARVVFGALGCVMLGTLLYTLSTVGSPFRKDLLYPWMVALLVNFYIVVVPLSVWVLYKESSWITGILWVVLLICLGSISTSVYIAVQLLRLSSQDPLYLVLLNNGNRAGNRYERTAC